MYPLLSTIYYCHFCTNFTSLRIVPLTLYYKNVSYLRPGIVSGSSLLLYRVADTVGSLALLRYHYRHHKNLDTHFPSLSPSLSLQLGVFMIQFALWGGSISLLGEMFCFLTKENVCFWNCLIFIFALSMYFKSWCLELQQPSCD